MKPQANLPPKDSGVETRARLVEAAGEVFAEQGFDKATIREICARAGANIAAVNYHFRDKETLYVEALRHAHRYSIEHYPHHGGLSGRQPAERRLEAFVRSFVAKLMDASRPRWHCRLLSREMTEPTAALNLIIEEGVRPQFAALCGIVKELAPNLTQKEIEASAASVIAQALHYHHCGTIVRKLHGHGDGIPFDLELLTRHITSFSLAALAGLNASGAGAGAAKSAARKGA